MFWSDWKYQSLCSVFGMLHGSLCFLVVKYWANNEQNRQKLGELQQRKTGSFWNKIGSSLHNTPCILVQSLAEVFLFHTLAPPVKIAISLYICFCFASEDVHAGNNQAFAFYFWQSSVSSDLQIILVCHFLRKYQKVLANSHGTWPTITVIATIATVKLWNALSSSIWTWSSSPMMGVHKLCFTQLRMWVRHWKGGCNCVREIITY